MAPAEKKPRARKTAAETKAAAKPTVTNEVAETKPKVVRSRKPKVVAVTGEQIAERAYYIWVDASDNDAFAHWVQAERELTTA